MTAIERAADVHVSARKASSEQAVVKVKGVPVESLFCNVHRQVEDAALPYNTLEPKLGDRVVSLTCPGVPFGLKGTVVTIHTSTKYVEVRQRHESASRSHPVFAHSAAPARCRWCYCCGCVLKNHRHSYID